MRSKPNQERVLLVLHPSRISNFKYYFLALLFFVLWIATYFFIPLPGFLLRYKVYVHSLLLFALLIVLSAESNIKKVKYIFDNAKITYQKGYLAYSSVSVEYNMIANYNVKQSFFQRLFNVGDLVVQSAGGSSVPEIDFKNVPKLKKVRQIIDSHITSSMHSSQL